MRRGATIRMCGLQWRVREKDRMLERNARRGVNESDTNDVPSTLFYSCVPERRKRIRLSSDTPGPISASAHLGRVGPVRPRGPNPIS